MLVETLNVDEELKHFQCLFDSAPLSYFELDSAFNIVSVNQAGASLLGREQRPLVGLPFGLVESSRLALIKLLDEKEDGSVRLELMRSGGGAESVAVLVHFRRVAHRLLLAATDLTVSEREHAQLQAIQQRFERVADVGVDGFWEWHIPSGRIIYSARPQARSSTGMPCFAT